MPQDHIQFGDLSRGLDFIIQTKHSDLHISRTEIYHGCRDVMFDNGEYLMRRCILSLRTAKRRPIAYPRACVSALLVCAV